MSLLDCLPELKSYYLSLGEAAIEKAVEALLSGITEGLSFATALAEAESALVRESPLPNPPLDLWVSEVLRRVRIRLGLPEGVDPWELAHLRRSGRTA